MADDAKSKNLASQYKVLFHLGEGAFGSVRLALHLTTKVMVAVKSIEITKKSERIILAERAALETLNHPNIIRLFQVLITPSHVNFILEYAPGGNLSDLTEENGPLQEAEAKKIFGQVVSAVKYCHNNDFIHRDIKPQNVLRDAEGNVKLTDFGLATKIRPGSFLKRRCGTKVFFAPELVLGEAYDGRKTDVWSLGVLLYFISTSYYPFTGKTMKEIEENIATGTYHIPPYFSGHLENLIHQILTVAPEMRPSIEDIEEHPWILKAEVNIPTDSYPDCDIVDRLRGMGFNANEILESLHKRKFDEKMGTYLLLQEQVRLGIETIPTGSAKPVNPCPTPPPSPAHASSPGLPLKRRASEPNSGLLHIRPSGQLRPDALALSGHIVARSVSLPPMALHFPKKKSPASASAPALHSGAVAAACLFDTITVEDKTHLPPEQSWSVEPLPPPVKSGRFKRFRKRIRDCLWRLCCIPRAPNTKTQCTSS
ncbi:putative sperm motility kinase W [Apodemus sylvaticus]|uniref:putative sperm motility kinase W n=1 Tax=Apodemus sylvaticus TaxID=10129 RepID=UPI0022440E41|nr:putative sperm motility kinase W [Apodemus sylvaticus]